MFTFLAAALMIAIITQAFILVILLRTIAPHEADASFKKAAMIAAGIAMGSVVIPILCEDHVPERYTFLTIIPVFAFAVYLVAKYCWVPPGKAAVVVLCLYASYLGVHKGTGKFQERMRESGKALSKPVAPPGAKRADGTEATSHKEAEETTADLVMHEIRNWHATRILWHTQLQAIRDAKPATLAIKRIRMNALYRGSAGKSTSEQELLIEGLATGTQAQQQVQSFLEALKEAEKIASHASKVVVKRFSATRSSAKSDRAFVISIAYRPLDLWGKASVQEEPLSEYETKALRARSISVLADQCTLRPMPDGNYALRVMQAVEPVAQDTGFTVSSMESIGVSDLPAPRGKTPLFNGYSARISASVSFNVFVDFIAHLQAANPCLRVRAIRITWGSDARLDLVLDLQWPVWKDVRMRDRLVNGSQ